MQLHDYLTKYDNLISEESYYNIPVRKEYVLAQIGRGKRVLDVGCLGGQISELIQKQHNDVWGVEVNPVAAAAARARGIRVKEADVEEGLPFDGEYFDVVNAGEILEHLYDTKHFFRECRRVLKDDGMFLFTAPNLNSLENRFRILAGGYLSMQGAYPEDHFGNHIRVFNIRKIRELCAQTGFVIEDLRGVFFLESHGKLIDLPLDLASRVAPGLAKLLIFKARKKKALFPIKKT